MKSNKIRIILIALIFLFIGGAAGWTGKAYLDLRFNPVLQPEDVKRTEDANFVYYEIDLRNQRPEKVDVQVEDGQIYIYAGRDELVENGKTRMYASNEFIRTFPVPENVDSSRFTVNQDRREIVISFPKIK